MHRFSDELSEAQLCAKLHSLTDFNVLVLVLLCEFVDQKFNLWVRVEAWHENLIGTSLGNRYTASQ